MFIIKIFAQPKIELSAGKGYFSDVLQYISPGFGWGDELASNPKVEGKVFHGSLTWFELTGKMKTGFDVTLFVGSGYTWQYHNDYLGFYWDDPYYYVYNMYGFTTKKDFAIKNHHFIPGGGLSYRSAKKTYISYQIAFKDDDIVYSFPIVQNTHFEDLGIILNFDYMYGITKHIGIGIRLMGHISMAIGLENIMLSPFIALRI
ncbi:MAG TPA: hypothetical protein PLS94_00555 [Prolixibacteraceae bacterium]|nr:hypothetical protein [Prolixibacteraceae bacterium]